MEIKGLKIIDLNSEGSGVGRSENFEKVLFVKGGVPGDILDVVVKKEEKNFAIAEIVTILEYSKARSEPFCKHFGVCGGCSLQHITYSTQLEIKKKQISDALRKFAKLEMEIPNVIPSATPIEYRNKMDFQFSNLSWIVNEAEEKLVVKGMDRRVLGLHVAGRFDRVLDVEECFLADSRLNKIRNFVRDFAKKQGASFYNPKYKAGLMRNLIFKTNKAGAISVILIFGEAPKVLQAELCMGLKKDFPEITNLFWGVNKKELDILEDIKLYAFKGVDFMNEKIGDVNFHISLKSFAQVNTTGADVLVQNVLEFGDFKPEDIVYDLYSGVGTFALNIARKAGKVIGIEIAKSSFNDAITSSQENDIKNAKFFKGDTAEMFNEDFILENGAPTCVVLDPPRAGLSTKIIDKLIESGAPKIIYVSCNPASFARDAALLASGYKLVQIQGVDMFPQTTHVEVVALFVKNV